MSHDWSDILARGDLAALDAALRDAPALDGPSLAALAVTALRLGHAPGVSAAVEEAARAALRFCEQRLAEHRDLANHLGGPAYALAQEGLWRAALDAYELALRSRNGDLSTYNNALWHLSPTVNGLPIDRARAKRWIALCVPFGEDEPNILVNAAALSLALGDEKSALRYAARAVDEGYDGATLVSEAELAPLRKHARFMALADR